MTHHSVPEDSLRSLGLQTILLFGSLAALLVLLPSAVQAQSSPLTVQPSTGRVGIGTTSPDPAAKLHVVGSTNGNVRAENTTSSDAELQVKNTGGFYSWTLGSAGKFFLWDYTQQANRFHVNSNGNVGIGTNNPTSRLHVNGTFTATSKNFQIDHPLEPEKKLLVHSALEGPEVAVYYRGEAQLISGEIVITLPPYFEALTRKENRTVQITAFKGWSPLYVADDIQGGQFTVRTANGGNAAQRFYWELKAVRADVGPLIVEKEKGVENMKVAEGPRDIE